MSIRGSRLSLFALATALPTGLFLAPAVAVPPDPGPPGTIYVLEFDQSGGGTVVEAYPPGGEPYALDLNNDVMRCLTVDDHGNVYICDRFQVQEQPADGTPDFAAAQGAGPQDVAVDPAGNLYVVNDSSEDHVHDVEVQPADGGAAYPIGTFRFPSHIDESGSGPLYVSDAKGVWRIEPDGTGQTQIAGRTFARQDFAIGADGTVYLVQDNDRTRIVVLPGNRAPRRYIKGFQRAGSVDVDVDGTLLVIDTGTDQVLRVAADGSARTVVRDVPDNAGLVAVYAAAPAADQVEFTSTPPAPALVGGTYRATASGPSSRPVKFSVSPGSAAICTTTTDGSVSFTGPGLCVVVARQGGDPTHPKVEPARQRIRIS